MDVFVWGVWLKWAFVVLLVVLFVWAVIAVKRATVGKREIFHRKPGHDTSQKTG